MGSRTTRWWWSSSSAPSERAALSPAPQPHHQAHAVLDSGAIRAHRRDVGQRAALVPVDAIERSANGALWVGALAPVPFDPRRHPCRFTLAQHEQLYKLPCGAPRLANFLPNTEETHHQLQVSVSLVPRPFQNPIFENVLETLTLPQTGFGMLGLREAIGDGPRIIGRVVISTADAVKSYGCSEMFAKRAHFKVPHAGAGRPAAVNHKIKLMAVSPHPELREDVAATLRANGWTSIDSVGKHGLSCVASSGGNRVAVAIIHDPTGKGTAGAKYKRVRKHVLTAATALSKKGGPVKAAILTAADGLFTYHRLVGRS